MTDAETRLSKFIHSIAYLYEYLILAHLQRQRINKIVEIGPSGHRE